MNPLSITANETKLLKHLDRLRLLQQGTAAPVLLCVAPTNRCQLACPHCCFRDRDRALELSPALLWQTTLAFAELGVKSVELTGGGEPTLYPELEAYVRLVDDKLGLPVGLNTNGLRTEGVPWERFAWVRLNANVLDRLDLCDQWIANVIELRHRCRALTSCYIVRRETTLPEVQRAASWATRNRIPLRLAPDCQLLVTEIRNLLGRTRGFLRHLRDSYDPEFVFLSDFNTPLGPHVPTACRIHLLKPLLWPDGWLYCCPSAELALENGSDVGEPFRVCRAEDAAAYYRSPEALLPRSHACSFCKYQRQNELLAAVAEPTDFNEFV